MSWWNPLVHILLKNEANQNITLNSASHRVMITDYLLPEIGARDLNIWF